MRALIALSILSVLLLPVRAQQSMSPEMSQAVSSKLMDEINAEIGWRARAIAAESKVKDLQSKLDAMNPKDAPK
jgi:hypothetical protein